MALAYGLSYQDNSAGTKLSRQKDNFVDYDKAKEYALTSMQFYQESGNSQGFEDSCKIFLNALRDQGDLETFKQQLKEGYLDKITSLDSIFKDIFENTALGTIASFERNSSKSNLSAPGEEELEYFAKAHMLMQAPKSDHLAHEVMVNEMGYSMAMGNKTTRIGACDLKDSAAIVLHQKGKALIINCGAKISSDDLRTHIQKRFPEGDFSCTIVGMNSEKRAELRDMMQKYVS